MKLYHALLVLVLTISSGSLFAQSESEIEDLVYKGVEYHDKGDFDNAIKTYKKALKIDSKSLIANYEIGLSYFSKGEHKKAIKYMDFIIEQNDKYLMEAYMNKGSSLDVLGKTDESIALLEKAAKETEGHYLLFYNLALSYFNKKNIDKSEENAIKAIELNSSHSSSHVLLAFIHNSKNNKVQSLLASYYFLLLEPSSNRSASAFSMLESNINQGISKKENNKDIQITLNSNGDESLMAAELMIGLMEAGRSEDEEKGKTEDEIFIANTKDFFTVMGELKTKKNKGIWWDFYTPFFYDLAKSEHMDAFFYYISQSSNENSKEWFAQNSDKLKSFAEWIKKH